MDQKKRRIGLIVNPVAGVGGKVALKGSDGAETLDIAFSLGAKLVSADKAKRALSSVSYDKDAIEMATYPGEMGERISKECGFKPTVLGKISEMRTTAEDTKNAGRDLRDWGAELIVFAGGDGTARDIVSSIDQSVPVIGIPTGVKIYSAVFATTPSHAAEIIVNFLEGKTEKEEREVLDIDEESFRKGVVKSRLYGYLVVPVVRELIQPSKIASRYDPSTVRGVAFGVLNQMDDDKDAYYILGPGSTVKAVGDELEIDKTLLGVDIFHSGELIGKDLTEAQIYKTIKGKHTRIVVTPIGGQGYIFGRGNQQLSSRIITSVGKANIIVISTQDKLQTLQGPLRVDTGSQECDNMLKGYIRVTTGPRDYVIWEVIS